MPLNKKKQNHKINKKNFFEKIKINFFLFFFRTFSMNVNSGLFGTGLCKNICFEAILKWQQISVL